MKSNVVYARRLDLEKEGMEIVWIEIHSKYNSFLFGTLYRPPNSNMSYWDLFTESVGKAVDTLLPLILTGDFNINMQVSGSNRFKNILSRFNLSNVVNEPTHFTETSSSCIDLLITNRPNIISEHNVLTPICSNHSVVECEINFIIPKMTAYKRTVRKYDDADYDRMRHDLCHVNWEDDVFFVIIII